MSDTDQRVYPLHRESVVKWNGWGYVDSQFEETDDGQVAFKGRYDYVSPRLPHLRSWMEREVGIDLQVRTPKAAAVPESNRPAPIVNDQFVADLDKTMPTLATSGAFGDRLCRSHGHTMREIFTLRQGKVAERIPDFVVWPKCHDDVEKLVRLAIRHDVTLIPFGGGTSVSGALECPSSERRMIVSLDTSQMSRILWIDEENWTICVEAGKVGQDLERELGEKGFTVGHEPDSIEFSTVGGWIATRASGMKKSVYGNIEDIVVHVRLVTPRGTMTRACQVPRISSGPDLQELVIGSEGCFGVVTEIVLKIRPLPKIQRYGSLVFRSFQSGVDFLRHVAQERCRHASIRLLDNEQFRFGQALKAPDSSALHRIGDALKKWYLLNWREYDSEKMCVATLLFEGPTEEDVAQQERLVYSIAEQHGGLQGGEENGRRGYMLTFLIAYLRDLGFEFGILSESFETSLPWSRLLDCCRNVKRRVKDECLRFGVEQPPLVSCRVTQIYDAGVCVYFYFAYSYRDLKGGLDPVDVYEEIESAARDEIIAGGGSISHHHGVGKLRQKWLKPTISETGFGLLAAVKTYLDPKNTFANGNLAPPLQGKL